MLPNVAVYSNYWTLVKVLGHSCALDIMEGDPGATGQRRSNGVAKTASRSRKLPSPNPKTPRNGHDSVTNGDLNGTEESRANFNSEGEFTVIPIKLMLLKFII